MAHIGTKKILDATLAKKAFTTAAQSKASGRLVSHAQRMRSGQARDKCRQIKGATFLRGVVMFEFAARLAE